MSKSVRRGLRKHPDRHDEIDRAMLLLLTKAQCNLIWNSLYSSNRRVILRQIVNAGLAAGRDGGYCKPPDYEDQDNRYEDVWFGSWLKK